MFLVEAIGGVGYFLTMPVYFIAITGGSGSGKTWLARQLKRRLGAQAVILTLDDFYRDQSAVPLRQRSRLNFDHPDAIDWDLLIECLDGIKDGKPVRLPRYDFTEHTRKTRTRVWNRKPIVVLEGLWLLRRPELRKLYSLSVFVECDEALRLERRIKRDMRERERSRASILRQFRTQVAPMHDCYVQPQAKLATMVLGPAISRQAVDDLAEQIQQWIKK